MKSPSHRAGALGALSDISQRQAYRIGISDGGRLPAALLVVSLMGFGSLCRESGLSLDFAVVQLVTMWAMPGQIAFYRTLRAIRDRRGCGILMVSHDLHLVMSATDHVLCLNGHVCCSGHPDDVSRDPAFLALFGPLGADALAPYHHAHDHVHDHVHGPGGCTAGCGPDEVPHDHAAAGHHHHH